MPKFAFSFKTMRIRIIAWSFIPAAIILLAMALVILYAYQQVTADLVAGKNREVVRLSAGQVASQLQELTTTLSTLAQNPDIRLGIYSLQRIALARAGGNLRTFSGVIILDSHGLVNAIEPPRPEFIEQDWSDRSYFRAVRDTKRAVYSDVTAIGREQVLVVAVPILGDQDAFRGTILGVFPLEPPSSSQFLRGLASLENGSGGNALLVDSAGTVIYGTASTHVTGANVRAEPAVGQALAGETGNKRIFDERGNELLVSFAPVPGTSWGLLIEENWSGLLAASQGYGRFLLALLALGVIIPTLLVTVAVKRITDPLNRLIYAAQEIAGGKFGQQIVEHTGDELEEVVKQFNIMSAKLADSYASLEQRVEIRTRELRTLNEIAEVVSTTLDLREIMTRALTKAVESIGMEVGTAYSIRDGTDPDAEKELVLAARIGLSPGFSQRVGTRRVRGTAIQMAAEAQKPVVWLVSNYPDPGVKQALELEGVRQVINVPLFAKGKFLGAFNVGTAREREITQEDLALLAAIGHQVAVAVENARLYDQAERSAALAERTRLARELHDSVTQSLYSVTMYAEAAQLLLTGGNQLQAAGHLRELRDTAQEALREMRLLIYELRPLELEKHGLAAALQERLETVEARGGVKADLSVEFIEPLPNSLQHELYHIAREALNNILKHAYAQQVSVRLYSIESNLCLEICDDGVGFDPADDSKGGLGLAGMKERVQKIEGRLEIDARAGQGTRIRVTVPLSVI